MLLKEKSYLAGLDKIPIRALLQGMFQETITPTILESHKISNVVPEKVALYLDVRSLPGRDGKRGIGGTVELLKKLFKKNNISNQITILDGREGYQLNSQNEVVNSLFRWIKENYPNSAQPVKMLLPASSDNSAYFQAGIMPLGFAPLIFPSDFPGFLLAHATNERIPKISFKDGLNLYLSALEQLFLCR
jgi:acetylornithine deacetylase/succinyl-diaminopimelate desuccinylase-like protein